MGTQMFMMWKKKWRHSIVTGEVGQKVKQTVCDKHHFKISELMNF